MEKRAKCYLDYYPGSGMQLPVPKEFVLHANSGAQGMGKLFFKNARPEPYIIVACLRPYCEEGFTTLIDKVSDNIPEQLFFYSIPLVNEIQVFRKVEVTVQGTTQVYKFRMQAKDTFKMMNDRFKQERDPNDKTPYIYKIDNNQIPMTQTLEAIPYLEIKIEAVPKLAKLELHQNGNPIWTTKIGLGHFKKTARNLFQSVILQNIKRQKEEFENHEVYYEYNHMKIHQDQNPPIKTGDLIKVHVNNKGLVLSEENSVNVEVRNQDGVGTKKKFKISDVQYKAPAEIASFVINQKDQESIYRKQMEVRVDNQPFRHDEMFRNGNNIEIDFLNSRSKQPERYSIASPAAPSTVSASPEFNNFKMQLKAILTEPDSEANDAYIKKLIASYLTERMLK